MLTPLKSELVRGNDAFFNQGHTLSETFLPNVTSPDTVRWSSSRMSGMLANRDRKSFTWRRDGMYALWYNCTCNASYNFVSYFNSFVHLSYWRFYSSFFIYFFISFYSLKHITFHIFLQTYNIYLYKISIF